MNTIDKTSFLTGGGAAAIMPAVTSLRPGEDFRTALNRLNSNLPVTPEEKARRAKKAAADLVSNALILPMLKQIRQSPWGKNTPFSAGIGENTFGPEFDIQIADHIAQGPNMQVTRALAKRLTDRGPEQDRVDYTAALLKGTPGVNGQVRAGRRDAAKGQGSVQRSNGVDVRG